ncbi:hypothetical protein LCGC14_1924410 [marine sediment metagenome]|uniref:Uncharacterized protein n=1 Tax=marine sediment metagenome TaxID=412755 RepID=A0A0F9FQH5_9ZZZZ
MSDEVCRWCANPASGEMQVANTKNLEKRVPVCSDSCAAAIVAYARTIGHAYALLVPEGDE